MCAEDEYDLAPRESCQIELASLEIDDKNISSQATSFWNPIFNTNRIWFEDKFFDELIGKNFWLDEMHWKTESTYRWECEREPRLDWHSMVHKYTFLNRFEWLFARADGWWWDDLFLLPVRFHRAANQNLWPKSKNKPNKKNITKSQRKNTSNEKL